MARHPVIAVLCALAVLGVFALNVASPGTQTAARQAHDRQYAARAEVGRTTPEQTRAQLGPPQATHWDTIGGQRVFELDYRHCGFFFAVDATLVHVECDR